ncbi:unnamed protein product [Microthlaspi erraticum]|uniref:Uncharacterized protein n=1 Tax=Microthlaspi erraticum TaxID=1685480 RepID=A0A6D2I0G0_9BRAS|nr:unnamed protein product [Microthlaspi erraticum]
MQAQQKKTQEKVDGMARRDDEEPLDSAAAAANGTMNRPTRVGKRAAFELEQINRRLEEFDSKVHHATSSAPELTKALADTQKSPLTRRIRRIYQYDSV